MTFPTITALVVEPDARRASQLLGYLSRSTSPCIKVQWAATLAEGLSLLAEEDFDVVVTRLKLPGGKSLEPLIRFRSRGDGQPLIALLEDDEKDALLDAAQSLADECLFFSDLDSEALCGSLSLAIDRQDMMKELQSRQSLLPSGRSPYKALINRFDEALFVISKPEGRLLFANETAQTWFSSSLEETVSELAGYGILDGGDIECEIETANPLVPQAELRTVNMDWRGQYCCMATLRDISKRKRAQDAFRGSQRRLELALKASNVGFWSWDLRERQVHCGDNWKRELGYNPVDFPRTIVNFRSTVHADDWSAASAEVKRLLRGAKRDLECALRIRQADGSYRSVICRAERFPDADGRLTILLGTHIDVTERVRLDAREEAERSGDLVAGVAKRLSRWARELEDEAVQARAHFRTDSEIAARLGGLAEKARRLSLLGTLINSGDSAPSSAASLSEGLPALASELKGLLPARSRIDLEIERSVKALSLKCPDALRRCLAECFLAIGDCASGDFGTVVRLRALERPDRAGAICVRIEIRCAGKLVFDLALDSLRLAGAIDAWAEFQSGETLVVFELPVEMKVEDPMAKAVRGGLVLLAEDEGVLRMAVQAMLESLGYTVLMARDGAEALDLFFEQPDAFTAALVDLHMPRIDGDSVLASIRSRRTDLPVLAMSGDEDADFGRPDILGDELCRFMAKPFGIASLRSALDDLQAAATLLKPCLEV